MNDFVVICFSTEQKYLHQLLTETQTYFGDSGSKRGLQDETELLEFVKNSQSDNNIQIIILDVQESDNSTFQFLNNLIKIAPSTIKLIISESSHLLKIQEQIENLHAVQVLNRTFNKNEFKLAVNTAKKQHSCLEKEKLISETVHDLKSPFTALLGISEILLDDWDELENNEKLDLIRGLKTTSENTLNLLKNLSL